MTVVTEALPTVPTTTPGPTAASPTRRRLLFVLPDLKGGGAPRVTLALLAALDPADYELSLLNLGAPGARLQADVPAPVRLLQRPRWLPGLIGAKLATLWHARRQDLLIAAVEMRATFCVHFAARWLRKPAIAWVHIAFEHWARGFSARHHRRARAAYRDIGHAVFVAEGARDSMQRWLGTSRETWRCIPNLFSSGHYRDSVAMPEAHRALLERMRERPTLIGIGRLEARKGFDRLLQGAARARAAGLDFDIVLLGEGPLRNALCEQAAQLGLSRQLHLPGHVGNPLTWLAAASVYVLSSQLEGLPTTILEAFSTRTPVIAFDCPSGPRELLDHGRAGRLLPMDDVDALALSIIELLESPSLRQQLGDAGHARLPHYQAAAVLPKWQALFDELAGDGAPAQALSRAREPTG